MSFFKTLQTSEISQYVVKKKINSGSFATVYLAVRKCRLYAIKKPYKQISTSSDETRKSLENEINMLKELKHPNIVKLHDVAIGKDSQIYLVLEYAPYDLASMVRDRKNQTKMEHKNWLLQISSALSYMHSKKILHGDLKVSNILYIDNAVKIADFGVSRYISKQMISTATTLWYRAPELLLDKRSYGAEIDIWSLGCIAYELICDTLLFRENTEIQMLDKIFSTFGFPSTLIAPNLLYLKRMDHHNYEFSNILRKKCLDEQQIQFLEQFFVYEAEGRITAEKLLRSEYLNT